MMVCRRSLDLALLDALAAFARAPRHKKNSETRASGKPGQQEEKRQGDVAGHLDAGARSQGLQAA